MNAGQKLGFFVMGAAILLALGLCVAAEWMFDYPISWAEFKLASCSAWQENQSIWCGLASYGNGGVGRVAIPLTYLLWVCAGIFFYGLCAYKSVISYEGQRVFIGRIFHRLKNMPKPPRREA
jgi:thiamine transporter ThiT